VTSDETLPRPGNGRFRAVLWDFGGVILSSPFEAFRRWESERGLPLDSIRSINATDPDRNAWARFERSEIDAEEFDRAFADEANARGLAIRGADVLALLHGDVRPSMVRALDRVREAGFLVACLTNNMSGGDGRRGAVEPSDDPRRREVEAVMERFHAVVESSKVGVRKPEPDFYRLACSLLSVEPSDCVFLDDLGVNLKPAAAMGMTTIKVLGAEQAIGELADAIGIALT
jgi:putative hydrolase of the HAD superfamily